MKELYCNNCKTHIGALSKGSRIKKDTVHYCSVCQNHIKSLLNKPTEFKSDGSVLDIFESLF